MSVTYLVEHRESSSLPKPLYGGTSLGARGWSGARYAIAVKSAETRTEMCQFMWVILRS